MYLFKSINEWFMKLGQNGDQLWHSRIITRISESSDVFED